MAGPAELAATQLDELKSLLEATRQAIERSLSGAAEQARPVDLDLPIGRVSRVDAMQHQQMAVARRQRIEVQLQQVRAALRRIDEGEYGECLACGEPVGYGRLKASPEAPFCVGCQDRAGRR